TEDKDSEAVVNFMKAYGVSDEDIKELINRELSDDELDGVAGGVAALSSSPDNGEVVILQKCLWGA
ncbi:MAG: hypothetical protein U9O56_00480, partial [Campylobacterota bacterium]|nr:hypothetical protein [Campylobacterota bacterium]